MVGGRRRESCTSSVGAASVRRLVRTGTAGVGGAMVVPTAMTIRAAAAACLARAFAAAAFLPLQVSEYNLQALEMRDLMAVSSMKMVFSGSAGCSWFMESRGTIVSRLACICCSGCFGCSRSSTFGYYTTPNAGYLLSASHLLRGSSVSQGMEFIYFIF